jgi:beta-1,2-mannobiose phosphorylase / 1,2-beta-oligomannan phosphorylase
MEGAIPIDGFRGSIRARSMGRREFLGAAAAVAAAGAVALVYERGRTEPSGDRVYPPYGPEAVGGWVKYAHNPVLGGSLGTCFDVSLLREAGEYRMWFSWRPRNSIGLVRSLNGTQWGPPTTVLAPLGGWEQAVNRPFVLRRGRGYHLWYTGQTSRRSAIGYARSSDGTHWRRIQAEPVLVADQRWEGPAVMCPSVLWDERRHEYRMWYSAGGQYEPRAIGYATSPDGRRWTKNGNRPVFLPDPNVAWERNRVTACHVVRNGDWHIMFYIGFYNTTSAQIGLARSRDGIRGWELHPANPIIRPSHDPKAWDYDAVYRPFAIRESERWLLWYNGRRGGTEQIGLAAHEHTDLGF